MSRRAMLVGAIMLLGVAPGALPGSPPAAPGSYPVALTRGSRLLVDARVNGHAVKALLDSAAEATLIDPAFAGALKLASGTTVAGQGSGDASFDAALIKGVELQVFGVTLPDQTVAVTELADVGRRLLGQPLDVILGREIFDAARLRIDIEGRRITVMPRDTVPPGIRLELTTENGVETLPVRLEDAGEQRAVFDLGNGSEVLVGSKLAARLHLLTDGRQVSSARGGGLGGETSRQLIPLHSLEVAGRTFREVPAAIDSQPSAADLNIGVSILRHFVITSDFAAHTLWLQPRP